MWQEIDFLHPSVHVRVLLMPAIWNTLAVFPRRIWQCWYCGQKMSFVIMLDGISNALTDNNFMVNIDTICLQPGSGKSGYQLCKPKYDEEYKWQHWDRKCFLSFIIKWFLSVNWKKCCLLLSKYVLVVLNFRTVQKPKVMWNDDYRWNQFELWRWRHNFINSRTFWHCMENYC